MASKMSEWKENRCSSCGGEALYEPTNSYSLKDSDWEVVLSEYCPHCGKKMKNGK